MGSKGSRVLRSNTVNSPHGTTLRLCAEARSQVRRRPSDGGGRKARRFIGSQGAGRIAALGHAAILPEETSSRTARSALAVSSAALWTHGPTDDPERY